MAESNMMVYGVACCNTKFKTFWKSMADKLDYKYHLLGENEEFVDYNWKIRKLYEGLSECNTEYVVLVDVGDGFFVRHSNDLYDKLIKSPDIIVGASPSFLHLKDEPLFVEYFSNSNEINKYPNAGFVAGKTSLIRDLYREILNETNDDHEVAHWVKSKIACLDYVSEFVANIPGDIIDHHFNFIDGQIIEKTHQSKPFYLHFPSMGLQTGFGSNILKHYKNIC